jgi:ion channel POLLUX/CASTOR
VPQNAKNQPTTPPLKARLRYRFDRALSRGPSVVIGWLGLLTLAIIMVSAVVLTVFRLRGVGGGGSRLQLHEAFWQSLLRVVDAGSFAGDTGWVTRIVTLIVTILGIFLAGSLIGLIASGVDQQIVELSKGRSAVLENDHTLILGWSSRVPAIVSELSIANLSRGKSAVVILASADKAEMEEELRSIDTDLGGTVVVCRSGEPWLARNLQMVNLQGARSIVVIGNGEEADAVKVALAVRAERPDLGEAHIVMELVHADTATSLRKLLGPSVVTVRSDDVVAELTAQACRQRGLSAVFRELLDFDGDELYFAEFPDLVGQTYATSQLAFEKASLFGRMRANGLLELNPPSDSLLEQGDQLIGIVEDDSVFVFKGLPKPLTPIVPSSEPPVSRVRRLIVVGWSELGPRVVEELDDFLDSNTSIEVLVDPSLVNIEEVRNSISVRTITVDVSELSAGPEVAAEVAARTAFHEVIVLGYRDTLTPDQADARTLLTLLAFKQVQQVEDVGPVRIVAELLDQRHAPLAQATGADDFIVSDQLTSLMIAQLSEQRSLQAVFDDLFDKTGCSVELRDARIYGAEQATTFGQVVAAASSLQQSAIGYRITRTGEVVVNPAKSAKVSFLPDDQIVVVAPSLSAS